MYFFKEKVGKVYQEKNDIHGLQKTLETGFFLSKLYFELTRFIEILVETFIFVAKNLPLIAGHGYDKEVARD